MNPTAQVSRLIPAAPGDVWQTLTSKEGMKAYMMGADVETDWQPGHVIAIRGEVDGKPFEDLGEVRSFEVGHSFSYTHQSNGDGTVHLVTFEIKRDGPDTTVTITQSNEEELAADPDPQTQSKYEKTWEKMLDGLEKAVTQH